MKGAHSDPESYRTKNQLKAYKLFTPFFLSKVCHVNAARANARALSIISSF